MSSLPAETLRRYSLLARGRLVAEILVTYAQVRWMLWRLGFTNTVHILRGEAERQRAGPGYFVRDHVIGVRLGSIIARTLRLLPADSRCLMRSLVLTRMLERRGVESRLVVAVAAAEGQFDSHAWVEHGGEPLLEPGDERFQRFIEI